MSRPLANLLLLIAGAIWGMGFVAQSSAMSAIGPIYFVGLRFAIATLFIAPFALMETRRATTPITRASKIGFIQIGLALFTGMVLQQFGLMHTTVTNSGFLTGLYVVMVPFLTLVVLKTRPHPLIWPAVAMTMTGIWLLAGGDLVALNAGDGLTIVAALFWSIQVILIARHSSESGRPLTLSLIQFAVCAVLGLLGGLLFESISLDAISKVLPEILFAGIFASGIAFSLQVIGQRYTTAPQAAIFLTTESIFAALFAALILGERISTIGYVGGGLIFAAILLVEVGPYAFKRQTA